MIFTDAEIQRVEQDVRATWTGNRMRDLAAYFMTPYQELADRFWHQESQVRAERRRSALKAQGC